MRETVEVDGQLFYFGALRGRRAPSITPVDRAHSTAASAHCHSCGGGGRDGLQLCRCVTRAIFRQCLGRYRRAEFEAASPRVCGTQWGIPSVEYRADFVRVCLLALPVGMQKRIFTEHILGRTPCLDLLAAGMLLSQGNFYHEAYRVREKCGRALEAAGLWPIHKYFAQPSRMAAQNDAIHIARMHGPRKHFTESWFDLHRKRVAGKAMAAAAA